MAIFMLWLRDSVNNDSYWLQAKTSEEARSLLALNVEEAAEARDINKFECVLNRDKEPPFGLIYRRLHGPVTIAKR